MNLLIVTLLGGFGVEGDCGRPLAVPTRKAQALLAYLALTPGQAHPRDKLAALLWPDAGPARRGLRQTLFLLRRALGSGQPARIVVTSDAVTLPAEAVQTDVATFERAVAEGTPAALEQAIGLYRGALLEGLGIAAPPFEDWLMSERERLRELAGDALARLLALQRATGATAAAARSAARLLALDPLQEAVHRTLMRLHAQLGRRDAALRQYQECVDVLRRELGVEPEAETQGLYRDILRLRPQQPAVATVTLVVAGSTETPLVGRGREVARLHEALAGAWARHGGVLAVVGEAGIGKSRLLAELGAEAARRGGSILLGRAHEAERIFPLVPWVSALRDAGVLADPEALADLGEVWLVELARLFPELAGARRPALADPADPLRLFEALARLLRHLALARPLVVLLEDCHWADDATLRFLAFFGRRIHATPILVAVSAREEELPDRPFLARILDELAAEGRLVRVPLGRLARDDTLTLVQRLSSAANRPDAVAQRGEQVWTASDGNPFIVVETVRALGDGVAIASPGSLPLPANVREMIARRLDRLSERARTLLRVAAVIGREFEFGLLQRAAGLGEPEAADGLEELVRRRVLHGVGDRFDFRHERIRDVVAAELSPPARRHLHASVAAALEGRAEGDELRHGETLGMHYREAGIWDRAVVFLRRAGRQAIERCAYREAVALLEQASAALESLPESRSTLEQAFEIRLELRNALLPLGDYPAVLRHLREAEGLAARLGDRGRQVRTASLLLGEFWTTGDHAAAVADGQRALAMAEALEDSGPQVLIRTRLGEARHVRGDYRDAAALFRQNIAALAGDRALERFGLLQPPALHSRAWLVSSLSELGMFREARAVAAEALAIAHRLDEPVALTFAWAATGMLALQQGHLGEAIEALARSVDAAGRDAPPWLSRFTGALGLAHAAAGDPARGLALLDQALEQTVTGGVLGGRSQVLGWLAEARLLARRGAAALEAAEQAVALATRLGERGHLAWALRVRAEAAAADEADGAPSAARDYGQAASVAGELEMRPLVARCRLGLGVLLARTGETERARAELVAARRLFGELEMRAWRDRAEHGLDRSG
jgi:DNA-binding SARP family transcriptional activator